MLKVKELQWKDFGSVVLFSAKKRGVMGWLKQWKY